MATMEAAQAQQHGVRAGDAKARQWRLDFGICSRADADNGHSLENAASRLPHPYPHGATFARGGD